MRVHEVVVAGTVTGPGLHHAVREGTQLGREVLLGETLVGARVDMPDEDSGSQLDGRRETAGGRAREDLDLDVDRGEALRELDDVDVHAARVAGAGLVERRGVHGEHRDAAGAAVEPEPRGCRRRATPEPVGVLAHGAFLLAAGMPERGCGALQGAATPEEGVPIPDGFPRGAVFAQPLPGIAQPFEADVRRRRAAGAVLAPAAPSRPDPGAARPRTPASAPRKGLVSNAGRAGSSGRVRLRGG